jgi:hypothetical protein
LNRYIEGKSQGFGAMAVHPSGKLFAVGERGILPRILMFSYPELKFLHILKGGTESGYSGFFFLSVAHILIMYISHVI